MVTGSPGGPRIITTTLHTILNVVDHGMDVQEAVAAPRYHHQWVPNKVFAEPELPESILIGLRERGHKVEVADGTWSSAQSIVIDPETRLHLGGSDPRGDGAALGFNPAEPPVEPALEPPVGSDPPDGEAAGEGDGSSQSDPAGEGDGSS